ncbi:hypothetical protein [Sinosporangium siamense]|uniref:Uncharacterized protein n=1 Tax=Sinosporangium siamense TaxID=1367973 RepID=A0A919V9W0_9ACTN|nr:hypothetical protein [Sinosporangium siamense]GII94757.1 hypothetical protein Ssi02_49880 [Sinosporangium siamense]
MDLTASPHAATELQRYAEALLATLAAGGIVTAPPPGASDSTDSWFLPAASALAALLHGEDALPDLAKAAQSDESRTALFLCLALAVAGHGDRIHASWLGMAFGTLAADTPVTLGQRALWIAAAKGAYGPAGKIFVLRKLDGVAVADQATPEQWLQALIPDEPATVVPPSLADYPELAEIPDLAIPAQASARLSRLMARCVEITSTRRATERTAQSPATWAHDEPLAVIRALINGEDKEAAGTPLVGHLLDDLRPGADPTLTAIAVNVVTPVIRTVAEEQQRLSSLPPPSTVTLPVLGLRVLLRPEGPDLDSLRAAEQQVKTENIPRQGPPWLAYALLALTAVAIVAGLVVTWPLALAAVLFLALGVHRLWMRRKHTIAATEHANAQVAELREQAQGAVWALHEYARESEQRATTAAEELTELNRLLRRGPRAA